MTLNYYIFFIDKLSIFEKYFLKMAISWLPE